MWTSVHIVYEHADNDDEEESDDEEQRTDCISKPAFKDVMNAITVLEDYSLFSNFGGNLMKAQGHKSWFLIWIAYLIRSSPQSKIFSELCKHFNKKKD